MADTDLLVREGGPPDGCEILLHRAPFGHDDLCSAHLLCLSRPYQSSSTQAPDLGRHYGMVVAAIARWPFPIVQSLSAAYRFSYILLSLLVPYNLRSTEKFMRYSMGWRLHHREQIPQA